MSLAALDAYAVPRELLDFRDAIRQIVAERVAPRAAEIDARGEYPWDVRELFAEHDILGFAVCRGVRWNGDKITQIYEGTNEIQRIVIARAMRG